MKIEITSLTDLLTVIKKQVHASNVPEKQKRRLTTTMQTFATQAFNLGANGKLEMEIPDE